MTANPPKGDPIGWARGVLQPGDVVIDGGANVGMFTEAAAKAVGPTGRVYAVEPDRRCLHVLNTLATTYPQVFVINAALTAIRQDVVLHQDAKRERSSLIRDAVENLEDSQMVSGMLLDDVCQHAALIKLDLQGSEPAALHGGSRMLASCRNWVVELWPHVQQANANWMLSVFEDCGFTPRWMEKTYQPIEYAEVLAYCAGPREKHSHVNVVFTK